MKLDDKFYNDMVTVYKTAKKNWIYASRFIQLVSEKGVRVSCKAAYHEG